MASSILDTGVSVVKNVGSFNFGPGSLDRLPAFLDRHRGPAPEGSAKSVVFLVDEIFRPNTRLLSRLGVGEKDRIEFISTDDEPKTDGIDDLSERLRNSGFARPAVLV